MAKNQTNKYWKKIPKKYLSNFETKYKSEFVISSRNSQLSYQQEKKNVLSFMGNTNFILEAATMTNSNIMVIENHNIVLRKDHLLMNNKVKLVTGGKTGHEPLFISYVGPGVLTAAVLGSDTSAPSARDIYLCLNELSHDHNAGIIAIVPNSFEEVINFGLGIEKARCNNILVDMVTIGDDCWESGKQRFGRRCLAGITLAFKIAGAMSEENKNMKDIYLAIKKLCMGTISCHLTTVPFIGTDLDTGTGMFLPTENLCELIAKMLAYLIDPKKYFSLSIDSSKCYVLMINSYTSERLFLYSCVKEVLEQLLYKEINVVRVYAGTFVSGERGFSITLLDTEKSIKMLRYTDTACCCQFWPRVAARVVPLIVKGPTLPTEVEPLIPLGPYILQREYIDIPVMFACKALTSSESLLNKIDVDHMFGTSILPAIEKIMQRVEEEAFPKCHPYNLLNSIAFICQDNIANINGTLLHIFFMGAAQAFLSYSREVPVRSVMWIEAIVQGVKSIKAYTQLDENDFTILSVLAPFACTLKFWLKHKPGDLEQMLEDGLKITDKLLKDTYDMKTPQKRKGMPEVTGHATLIALTAIVEGIRFVLHRVNRSSTSCKEDDSTTEIY